MCTIKYTYEHKKEEITKATLDSLGHGLKTV